MNGGRRKTEDSPAAGRRRTRRCAANGQLMTLAAVVLLSCAGQACGKKGPPLAPLNLAPESPQQPLARRLGDSVFIQMKVPAKNAAGRGSFSVDRLEVYAVTLAPGATVPPNSDLIKPAQLVAKIPVRPPPDPDAPDEGPARDTRPKPGDTVTFVEKLTEAQLVPRTITTARPPKRGARGADAPGARGSAPGRGAAGTPASPDAPAGLPSPPGAPAAPPQAGPTVLTRTYVVRGVAKNGNAGLPTVRIDVPLLAAPGRARAGASPSWDETSVVINWNPPATASDEAPGVLYNVYSVPAAGTSGDGVATAAPVPLNPQPLETTSFTHPGAAPGKEQCFIVRTVAPAGTTTIESDPSDPICVTPKDTFPPAAPKSLTAVADSGAVNLVWDANTESDLAGYFVLRGEAPGDNLQPLTPDPIHENRYTDRTVASGTTYFYAVLAVDKAGNRSTPSNRVQQTAR